MVMNFKNEFNYFKFDTLDLVKEVKYQREIKWEFYKRFSNDTIEDLKRKLIEKELKNGERKEDNEILDN